MTSATTSKAPARWTDGPYDRDVQDLLDDAVHQAFQRTPPQCAARQGVDRWHARGLEGECNSSQATPAAERALLQVLRRGTQSSRPVDR